MKDLELTQSVHSPLLSVGSFGIAIDDHSHLAIGMFLGDGGYGCREMPRQLATLSPGSFWDRFGGIWSHCSMPIADQRSPIPLLGWVAPLTNIFNLTLIMGAYASVFCE